MRKLLLILCSIILVAFTDGAENGTVLPQNVSSLLKDASDGNRIVIRNGEYKDIELRWNSAAEVTVVPETVGGVVFTGETSLHLSGKGIKLCGFVFKNCLVKDGGAVVEFKDGSALANDCSLSDCVFDSCNGPKRESNGSYVTFYGRRNVLEGCSLLNKKSLGVTVRVRLNYPDCDQNNHLIRNNYFGPRKVYGSNGAETIQVGVAQQCMDNSKTIIENNFFDRCSGEVETVSLKSCENVVRGNVFYECEGVLALRHGDRCCAENNIFIGNLHRNTGGIRVVGEDQKIIGNEFYGLTGKRFFAPLALMNGVPNSLPNRYIQVKRTVIKDNLYSDCAPFDLECGKDFERTLAPEATVMEGNNITKGKIPPSRNSLLSGKGVSWYKTNSKSRPEKRISLGDGETIWTKTLVVDSPTIIEAAPGTSPVVKLASEKSGPFIRIVDGGSLVINGVTFDGTDAYGKAGINSCISSADLMFDTYYVKLERCTFRNFLSGAAFVGRKNTLASLVEIRDCTFDSFSRDVISLSAETDLKGRYNAEEVIIDGCTFHRTLDVPINILRGGYDESTAGPIVRINNCSFDDCCNQVRGSVISAIGVQDLEITGCRFTGSGRGGYSIRLNEAPWERIILKDNSFINSGRVLSNRN